MTKHKAGLHKDVSVIFDGVWNPEIDNQQPSFSAPVDPRTVYIQPAPVATERLPEEKPKSATIIKLFKGAPGGLFSSRARREKKRLMSISRHLIINQSS